MDVCEGGATRNRRYCTRFLAANSRSQPDGNALGGVAATASSPDLRQLYLTAVSPGGSRAQPVIPVVPRSCGVLHRLHSGGASDRSVAASFKRQGRRSVCFAPLG